MHRSILFPLFICQVLANTLGALHEFANSKRTLLTMRDEKVIPVVVRVLKITENAVLVNATRVLAVCAKDESCRRLVLKLYFSLFY